MSIDLERRLRDYGEVLDAAIEFDLGRDIQTEALDEVIVPLSESVSSPRRTALVVVAAAGLLIGGSLALLTDHQSASQIPAADVSESAPGTTVPSFPGDTTLSPDDPSLWNPIRVAPGTVGWFEFGDHDLPPNVVSTLGAVESWTADYAATFFQCVSYTVDADGPICTGLLGGNFVAPITFGGDGELGTHLGDMSTADLLWFKAQGSLWGYDEMTSPPTPTPVAVGAYAGLMYSNAGTSYLVWERAPGVHLWIRASDVSIDDMVDLALATRPATLPDRLPLRIIVDRLSTSGAPSEDDLMIGSHPGMPMCAVIGMGSDCVSLPPVSDVAMVVGRRSGMAGPITAVAAIFPLGSNKRLRVGIADADEITVEPVVSPLGFEYAIFRASTERIIAGGTVDPDGSVVATAPLSTVPTSATPTTAGPPARPPGKHPSRGGRVRRAGRRHPGNDRPHLQGRLR